jgi:hypothetical protein
VQRLGGGQAGRAGADHDDVRAPAHAANDSKDVPLSEPEQREQYSPASTSPQVAQVLAGAITSSVPGNHEVGS